ncbi:MAG: hypothetical protein L6Q92_07390 [Phycisphaerae bacterium]|nr:hypothetical protein [Phycisphaerae bacterium]
MVMVGLETVASEPCVWMTAGVIRYKLCDHHFDCEHCALDAAIRGRSRDSDVYNRTTVLSPLRPDLAFPADRRYGGGHIWLRPVEHARPQCQLGIDAFAAALLECPFHVHWNEAPRVLRPSEAIFELEFDDGSLAFSVPFAVRLLDRNAELQDDPERLIRDPYGNGWIAVLAHSEANAPASLMSCDEARDRARLDLRRTRRRIALHLLAENNELPPADPLNARPFAGPWRFLIGPEYLNLVRESLH